ncbi:MAG: hypothetical protein NTY77_09590 [Elusimicrobia bacterium]|nr:hypothetical protein [Elusimicrobiota bacterium]
MRTRSCRGALVLSLLLLGLEARAVPVPGPTGRAIPLATISRHRAGAA